ncbi:hypothetical protein B6U74_06720 [Candidatus Bathyarchaeota archaeon ex4484_205]|nr:MAG: hypothetical protein B6U74_06720 [Candidatus Bathyarchaeota archaeon ex4484_205]
MDSFARARTRYSTFFRVVGECPKIPGEFDVINIEVEIPLIHGSERRILFRETSEVVPESKTIKNIENDESGVHKYLWYFFVLLPLLGIYVMVGEEGLEWKEKYRPSCS